MANAFWLLNFLSFFLFFLYHTFFSQGEPSIWHLISWIFVLLFQGGCGSTYAGVHWGGNSKRERESGRDQSLSYQLCESAYRHREDILPDARKCHQKRWHYRQCHLFLNRESSRGLCHPPIIVHH